MIIACVIFVYLVIGFVLSVVDQLWPLDIYFDNSPLGWVLAWPAVLLDIYGGPVAGFINRCSYRTANFIEGVVFTIRGWFA